MNTPLVFFVSTRLFLKWLVSAAISTSCPAWICRSLSAIACIPFAFTSWPAESTTSLPLTCVPTWVTECCWSRLVLVVLARLPLFVLWNSSKSRLSFAPFNTRSFSAIAINFASLSNCAPSDKIFLPVSSTSPLPFMRLTTASSTFSWR